jgi:phosphoribosylformylglycinamidine synthase
MKFGVVVFPGSNCDQDIIVATRRNTGHEVVTLWHKDTDLQNCDFIFLPGGFSYGDYLRSGAIAKLSPIMNSIVEFANKGGFVMGICNGFQILCEAQLLDGALLRNSNQQFICRNQYVRVASTNSLITNSCDPDKNYNFPIAHAEGRFYADEATLEAIEAEDRVLFRYSDDAGNIGGKGNPNGSAKDIAGICNKGRNVFGMMPHPERASDLSLLNTDGIAIFESILSAAAVN